MRVDPSLDPAEVAAIAGEAYVYAFPMLMGYRYAYATFLQPASPAYRWLLAGSVLFAAGNSSDP